MNKLSFNENFNSPMGYLNLNNERDIIEINSAAAEIMGIDKPQMPPRKFIEFLTADDIPRFNKLLDLCKQKLKPYSDEFKITHNQKNILSVYLTAVPFIYEEDVFYRIIFDSISDQKNPGKILFESEKRFRQMADNSPVMIWMTDAENKLEYMNKTKLEFLGKSLSDLTGEGWMETRHPEDREKFLKAIQEAAREKRNFSIELRVKDRNGNYRWLLDSAAPRFLDDNTFAGFIGSGVDITERRNAEKIVNESEKRFRLMADNSPVMIWMTDAENKLEYMNKTKLGFLGREFKDLTNEAWMETRHPDDKGKFLHALLEASREKRNFTIEMRVKDRNGDYRWLLDSAAPRFLDDHTFAGFIGSGVDITEEKNFRTNLQRSLKEKEILLTEIHHRVKNNLQVISSLLSLQAANVEDENVLAMFRTCSDRIRSMAVLHEKLYQSENIHKVNIREYLNDLLSYLLMSYKSSLDINLKLNVVDFEVSIGLCLNMGLILNELVSNALKHAFKDRRKGEILVDVMKTGEDKVRILVKDDGKGIPEDFDIEESKSVGLMLVKTLIDQHNGTMEIIRNGNTEFRIYLQYSEESNITGPEDKPVSPDAKLADWVVS